MVSNVGDLLLVFMLGSQCWRVWQQMCGDGVEFRVKRWGLKVQEVVGRVVLKVGVNSIGGGVQLFFCEFFKVIYRKANGYGDGSWTRCLRGGV